MWASLQQLESARVNVKKEMCTVKVPIQLYFDYEIVPVVFFKQAAFSKN